MKCTSLITHEPELADSYPLHSWDKKAHQYKVVESLKPKDAIGELDHYVFVVRARIGEYRLMFSLKSLADVKL
jgi:hypothetical protein